MPSIMYGYVQSVVVQGTVYVGGSSSDNRVVIAFDITSRKWTTLPPYTAHSFAIAATSNQLVLVGGEAHGGYVKVLGAWDMLTINNGHTLIQKCTRHVQGVLQLFITSGSLWLGADLGKFYRLLKS